MKSTIVGAICRLLDKSIMSGFLLLSLASGCNRSIAVTGVKLDKNSIALTEGESVILIATVEPADATNGAVTWTSTDATVASVNNGLVKALKEGVTTIKVITADGGKTASCSAAVKSAKISVTGVTLDRTSLTLTEGETGKLVAAVTPSNATDPSVSWSSSEKGIATVDSNGGVIALKAGSAIITVTTTDGNKTANCLLTVKPAKVAVTGVTLDKSSASLIVGQTVQLKATVSPDNATDKTVTWTSSNTNVASVDENGYVTGKTSGSATVTAVTRDGGKMARCDVAVTQPVVSVSLDKTSLSLTEGDVATLTAVIAPQDATDKEVSWSSSAPGVVAVEAVVSSTGSISAKLTAIKEGSSKITVTTVDGGKKAECAVAVSRKVIAVTGVTLDKSSASLIVGQTVQLKATVSPDNATDKTVTWTSSNTNVASVDENGLVTAMVPGTAVVRVTTTDGSKTASCSLIVNYDPANLYFPDAKFKAYLLANFDTNHNGAISTSEASSVTAMDCTNMEITSLEGIQFFVSLNSLICTRNTLDSLDVSKNLALTKLWCNVNQIKTLDVRKNVALQDLDIDQNLISAIDLSMNANLKRLNIFQNLFSSIDVSRNPALEDFYCSSNRLTSMDVSHNLHLKTLVCAYNRIQTLDASMMAMPADFRLYCGNQQDGSGGNIVLSLSLQVSQKARWDVLKDDSYNANVSLKYIDAVNAPDANFNAYLLSHFDSNSDGMISNSEASTVSSIDCSSLGIASLQGIEAFTALSTLICPGNNLTQLNLSKNTKVVSIYCQNNQIATLDLSSNTSLGYCNCSMNSLSSIHLGNNKILYKLLCSNNQLESIDVSSNTGLYYLSCSFNKLKVLDASAMAIPEAGFVLYCGNQVEILHLTLSYAQKTYWENYLQNQAINNNVSVTYK